VVRGTARAPSRRPTGAGIPTGHADARSHLRCRGAAPAYAAGHARPPSHPVVGAVVHIREIDPQSRDPSVFQNRTGPGSGHGKSRARRGVVGAPQGSVVGGRGVAPGHGHDQTASPSRGRGQASPHLPEQGWRRRGGRRRRRRPAGPPAGRLRRRGCTVVGELAPGCGRRLQVHRAGRASTGRQVLLTTGARSGRPAVPRADPPVRPWSSRGRPRRRCGHRGPRGSSGNGGVRGHAGGARRRVGAAHGWVAHDLRARRPVRGRRCARRGRGGARHAGRRPPRWPDGLPPLGCPPRPDDLR
jgi:hypothetical protein